MDEVLDGLRTLTAQAGLADLAVGLLLVGAVLGGLRRRSLLAAIGSLAGSALTLWLAAGAVLVWGPDALQDVVQQSALLQLVPPPTAAWEQLGRLVAELSPGERVGRL